MGVKARRHERYYQDLLSLENDSGCNKKQDDINIDEPRKEGLGLPEKWKGQIEKVDKCFQAHVHTIHCAI